MSAWNRSVVDMALIYMKEYGYFSTNYIYLLSHLIVHNPFKQPDMNASKPWEISLRINIIHK